METNLENAKKDLLCEMKNVDDWRNYWRDTISFLKNEHELDEDGANSLYEFMLDKLKI